MNQKAAISLFRILEKWWPSGLTVDIQDGMFMVNNHFGEESTHFTERFRIPVDITKVIPFGLIRPFATGIGVVTQRFGEHPEVYKAWGLPGHEGIDWGAPLGANVYACAAGKVYRVHQDDGRNPYGTHVRIEHTDGYKTIYAHLSAAIVAVGDKVYTGEKIGKVGSTGNSTGPHLHVTMKRTGATVTGKTSYPYDIIDPTDFFVEEI